MAMRQGLLLVIIGVGLVVGSSAYTAVSAERATAVDLTGEAAASLGLAPHTGPNGRYVEPDATGQVRLRLTDGNSAVRGTGVNGLALTRLNRVVNVSNRGTQPVAVWITDASPEITFTTVTDGHGPLDSEERAITLEPGRTAEVGLAVDTRASDGTERLLDTIRIHAVAIDGTAPVDAGHPSGGSDGGTVDPAPGPTVSVADWPSARRDRHNTGASSVAGPRTPLTEAWSQTFEIRPYDRMSPVVADGRVYFGTQTPEVVALNASTGVVAWRTTAIGTPLTTPVVTASGVYVVTERYDAGWQYALYKLDPETGAVVWAHSLPDGDPDGAGPTVVDGVVYSAGEDGVVRALDNRTGALRWDAVVGIQARGRPAVDDGTVYVTARTGYSYHDPPYGRVTALNASDGTEQWHVNRTRALESSVVVANRTGFVVDGRNRTFAIDLTTGAIEWETALSGNTWADPAVADGRLFVVTEAAAFDTPGTTYALDTATGGVRWSVPNGLDGTISRPTVAGATVYTYDRTDAVNKLVGRDVENGTLRVSYPFDVTESAIAIDDDGALYLGGDYHTDPRIYKLAGEPIDTSAGDGS